MYAVCVISCGTDIVLLKQEQIGYQIVKLFIYVFHMMGKEDGFVTPAQVN